MAIRLDWKLLVLFGCSFGGSSALAAIMEIEEIVVTAQKRESDLQETPIAITALTADNIEERQIDAMRQVQYYAPNLVFNSLGGTTNLYLRGIGTDINDSLAEPGVALYVDGVYQGVTGDQSAVYNDLERIEVLRGPQGTLYGRNSTGGNVHIFTRKPDFDPSFNASLLLGDYGRVKGSIGAQTGVIEDRLAMRGNLVVDQSDGYRDNPFDGKKIEERDLISGSISALITPTDSLEILLRGDYTDREDDTPRWDYMDVVPGSGLNPFLFGGVAATETGDVMNNGETEYKTKIWGLSGTVDWNVGSVTVRSITAYRESDWGGPYDNDGTDINFLQAKPAQTSEQFSQELDVIGTAFDDRLDWIVGAYYFQQDSMGEYTYELEAIQGLIEGAFGLPPGGLADPTLNPFYAVRYNGDTPYPIPFNDIHTEQDTSSAAAFVQGTLHFTDRFRMIAGVRYTSDEKDIKQFRRTNVAPDGCEDLRQDKQWDDVTWKLGADFDLAEDVLLYGSVSRGFHAGGFNGGGCGDEYDPESLIAYEAGLKMLLANRRVQLNLSGFYYDYDDYQARQFLGGFAVIENATKATVTGAEAEFVMRPVTGLEIDGSVSWLDGEFDEFLSDNPMTPGVQLEDLEGNRLLRAPEYSYNLGAQYTFALGIASSLTARYEVAFKDDYYVTIFNEDYARIDSLTVQHARLIWSNGGKWQIQGFVENLSDEKYLEALVVVPTLGGTMGLWALPRTWGLQISYGGY